MSYGIVGVVLWGTIAGLAIFLLLLGRAMVVAHRDGPRQHLHEPVLRGWDETRPEGPAGTPDAERPPR